MYSFLLNAHSGLRWLVLLVAIVVVIKSVIGIFSKGNYSKFDNILGISFTSLMDLQVTMGVILYFISPIVKNARMDFGAAMSDSELRFYAVEHLIAMILVIVLVHIGRSKSKKALESKVKFKRSAIFYGIALVLMLISIPWDRLG